MTLQLRKRDAKLRQACLEEMQDETYQAELSLWEACSEDGLLQHQPDGFWIKR